MRAKYIGLLFGTILSSSTVAGPHLGSPQIRRPAASVSVRGFNYFYLGWTRSAADCLAAAKSQQASHYYFGAARFANGSIARDICFAVTPNQSNVPANQEKVNVWLKSAHETPVTENVQAHENAFAAMAKKMEQKSTEPLPPAGPWYAHCLTRNIHADPHFKPFFSFETVPLNRPELFVLSEDGKALRFGTTDMIRRTNDNSFSTSVDVYKGKETYQSIAGAEAEKAGVKPGLVATSVDSHISLRMSFFRLSGGEPFAITNVKSDFVNRYSGPNTNVLLHSTDSHCLYTRKKAPDRSLLETIAQYMK